MSIQSWGKSGVLAYFVPKIIHFTKRIAYGNELDYWDCIKIKKLHLVSLQRGRERYTIIHTWKILQNKAPNSTGL